MINESRLLNEANSLFVQKKFDKALFLYSQLSSNFPENKEYKIYALFCDVATEDIQKAMSLYDYFTVVKDENLDEAVKYVEDVIHAYDGDVDKMMEILKDLSTSTVEALDAIRYEVEKELKAAIHPDLQIVNVPHGMEDKLEEL